VNRPAKEDRIILLSSLNIPFSHEFN